MNKVVDKKFFEFIGLDIQDFKGQIDGIEQKIELKSIENIAEREVAEKLAGVKIKEKFSEGTSIPPIKYALKRISDGTVYKADVDMAFFLLLGSYLSEWTPQGEINESLPFSIETMKKTNGGMRYETKCASAWCKALQELFKKYNMTFLLKNIDVKTRVEKFSYLNMVKTFECLDEQILACLNERNKKLGEMADNSEKEQHRSFFYMTDEGVENHIVLDKLLNCSLSIIFYYHLKDRGQLNWEYIEQLVKQFIRLKCPILRNRLADELLPYMLVYETTEEDKREQVIKEFTKVVDCINYVYTSLVYKAWIPIYKGINEEEEKELWDGIIKDNYFMIQSLDYPEYKETLCQDIRKEKGIFGEIEKDLDIESTDAISRYRMLERIFAGGERYYMKGIKVCETDIEKINDGKLVEAEKRGNFRYAKTPSELYIKLQCIMKLCKS